MLGPHRWTHGHVHREGSTQIQTPTMKLYSVKVGGSIWIIFLPPGLQTFVTMGTTPGQEHAHFRDTG